MINKLTKISLLTIAFCSFSAWAQQPLTHNIYVDVEVAQDVKKAVKTNDLPSVLKSTANESKLGFSDWAEPTITPADIQFMSAYGYRTEQHVLDKKGYVDFAIGTQLNIAGSAGYRAINTNVNSLDLWLQHNSTWTGANHDWYNIHTRKQKVHDTRLAATYKHAFNPGSLHVDANFRLNGFNYYGMTEGVNINDQRITDGALNATWKSVTKPDAFNYYANLKANITKFGNINFDNVKAEGMSQNHVAVKAGGEYLYRTNTHVGLDASFNILNNHHLNAKNDHETITMLTARPFIRYNKDRLNVLLGVEIAYSTNDGTALRFAPNFNANYDFGGGFGVYFNVDGGKKFTLLSDVTTQCRYIDHTAALANIYTPFDAELGFTIGPKKSFSATVFAGYRSQNNYNHQAMCDDTDASGAPIFYPIEGYVATKTGTLKGFKVGAEFLYAYRSLVDASLRFAFMPQNGLEKGYATAFANRSKFALDAKVAAHPIDNLTVALGFEVRSGRKVYGYDIDLGNILNLTLDARYNLTEDFSVFLMGNNLLNRTWDNFYSMGAQRLGVMAGLQYLF